MRWAILVVYSALLLIGYVVVVDRRTPYPPGWVATQELAPNRLLQSGDIAPIGGGQYIKRLVKAGEALQPGDLVNIPDLSTSDGELAILVALPRNYLEERLVAGSAIRLCKADKVLIETAIVRAVMCPLTGDCNAIAVLASEKAANLAAEFNKAPLPWLQPVKRSPACK